MKLLGNALLCVTLAGAVAATPVRAACWTDAAAEATQVRDLQTRLMVATLKCQTAGIDITAPYNDFIRSRRIALAGINARIKDHFAGSGASAAEAQAAYDRFVTSLANAYGAEETSAESCAAAAAQAIDAAAEGTDLLRLASAGIAGRTLAGERCAPASGVLVAAAAATPPTASPPAIIAAASRPDRPPLPPEVVAAMAVIAAFAREQGGPAAAALAASETPAPVIATASR